MHSLTLKALRMALNLSQYAAANHVGHCSRRQWIRWENPGHDSQSPETVDKRLLKLVEWSNRVYRSKSKQFEEYEQSARNQGVEPGDYKITLEWFNNLESFQAAHGKKYGLDLWHAYESAVCRLAAERPHNVEFVLRGTMAGGSKGRP